MVRRWCVTAGVGGALAIQACSRSPRPTPPPGAAPPAIAQAAPASPSSPAPAPSSMPAEPAPPLCGDAGHVLLFAAPAHPARGKAMSVMAVSEQAVDGRLSVTASGGAATTALERHGGPPYYWLAQVEAPTAGTWHASFSRDEACGGSVLAKRDVTVSSGRIAVPPAPDGGLWATRAEWSASLENVYSAWIEHLFDAPIDVQPSWNALHEVLRDRARNLLFDYLGAAEDEQGIVVRPDCADLPYFLRAYFAFKLGLPFGWSHCSRGEGGTPPTCTDFATSVTPFPPVDGKPQSLPSWADPDRPHQTDTKRFGEFLRTTLADAAQSGAGRTPAKDETGDYYPVALSVDTLRPGTIFADPYGHVLVIAKRIAQTPAKGGILLAVDGQPDGTVARKRFWRGNFLFAIDPALGSPGFKPFRPIVHDKV
ncbi:MAG TPA: hypothetical protein VN894_15205, partial [Polyangiaceae bacterium]|nr:hypothetical protein [Polyangiaceae bacterium]